MNEELQALRQEIESIKSRNKRVEEDKAWETSLMRTISIATITYSAAAVVLYVIGAPFFYIAAFVPALGYILSTRSLRIIKKQWVQFRAQHVHD